MELADLERELADLVQSANLNPLKWIRWTPAQDRFHRIECRRKLFRAGNQALGKTYAAIAEVIWRATGTHPHFKTKPPPIEAWVICTSWSQAVAIMRKFQELVPADVVDHKRSSNFSVKNGYGKDNPTVIFLNGSIVRFRTTNQGAVALQGATIDLVLIDEPTDLDIYRELDRRLTRTGGDILIAATPVNRDCTWLRDMVESGVIEEVHARLTVENLTPLGTDTPLALHDGTPMDQAWIDEQWRITPPIYAPVVLDGEWDALPEGVFFDVFDRRKHVTADASLPNSRIVIGFDHSTAAREYGQVAIISRVAQHKVGNRTRTAILTIGEVVMPGSATTEQFAVAVLAELARLGISWSELHQAWGVNPVMNRWTEKSNRSLERALRREIGVAALRPRIGNAKEGRGSAGMVDAGCRFLFEALVDDLWRIDPRCELLIEAIETWDYSANHPAKDRIDGVRYSLKRYIFPKRGNVTEVRMG